MNWPKSSFILIVLSLALAPKAGRTSEVLDVFGVENGLPANQVTALAQDAEGFLWIGTSDGLARFDGVDFEIFRNEPSDSRSLPGNQVQALLVDSADQLWVALEGKGLAILSPGGRKVLPMTISTGATGNSQDVWSLTEDNDGVVWVGLYNAGLRAFSGMPPAPRGFPADSKLTDQTVFSLTPDPTDGIWIGTIGSGLLRLDKNGSRLRRVPLDEDNIWAISATDDHLRVAPDRQVGTFNTEHSRFDALPDIENQVTVITPVNEGGAWLASYAGLTLVDELWATAVEEIRAQPAIRDALPTDQVNALLLDREGSLWIGTSDGLARLPAGWGNFDLHRHDPLGDQSISANPRVAAGSADSIWVGGVSGWLDRVNRVSGKALRLARPEVANMPETGGVWAILAPNDEQLWLGLTGGLASYLPGTGQTQFYSIEPRSGSTVPVRVEHLARDRRGQIWLGVTERGLLRFDPSAGAFEDLSHLISGQFVEQVTVTPDGEVWIASDGGLDRISPQSLSAQSLLPDGQYALSFAHGLNQDLWLAHRDGLAHYRKTGDGLELVRRFTQSHGIPQIRFGGIAVDTSGDVWLTSRRGLYRYRPASGLTQAFGRPDGLVSAEFRERPLTRMAGGELLATTRRSVVSFDPLAVSVTGTPPNVVITGVRVANQDLEREDQHWQPIALEHSASDISFQFAALSLVNPVANQYAYQLQGLDENWIYAGNQRSRTYNNLAPGSYRFMVKAADARGYWNEQPATLNISVPYPPWRTGWAYAAYVLSALGLLAWTAYGFRGRLRRGHELDRARERQNWAETQRDMTLSLTSSLEVTEILKRLLQGLSDVVKSDRAVVSVDCSGLPRAQVHEGFDAKDLPNFRDIRNVITQLSQSSMVEPTTLSAMGQLGGSVTVPVSAGERVMGVVTLHREDAQGYMERDRMMAATYARQAGVALENARLFREVRKLADEAESANQAKSDFLAKMSHEIRTPMNGVLGMTEMLLETPLSTDQRNYAQAVQDSGNVLLNIINDILDLSKIEAGKLELEEIDIQLGQLVEQTVKLFSGASSKKGIELGYVIAPDLNRHLVGDPVRIRQVLMNLLNNALKFTERGRVRVDVTRGADNTVRFVVKDTGIGMDTGAYRQLFQPFTQADQSTSRRYGGTGLGLAICRQLVDKMRGSIDAVTKPGHGSLFWFELPLTQVRDAVEPRLPGIDWLERGFCLLLMRPSVAREAIDAFLSHQRIRVEVSTGSPGQPLPAELPTLVIAQAAAWNSDHARQLARPGDPVPVLWVVDDGPAPSLPAGLRLAANPLRAPIFESELMLSLMDASSGIPPAPAKPSTPAPSGRHILVVEDNPMNQAVVLEMLDGLGHTVDVVDSATECINQLKATRYDAILMDCDLPGQDGLELSALLRRDPRPQISSIPIIALTAHAGGDYHQRCLKAGMNAFLDKPISKARLRQALEDQLKA
ncbi:MAG: ATP-binding protein [Lysobacterales bacterium]